MSKIDEALTNTIADMIRNSTACGCCDNDTAHAALIMRALERTPCDWWPDGSEAPLPLYEKNSLYIPILKALVTRSLT